MPQHLGACVLTHVHTNINSSTHVQDVREGQKRRTWSSVSLRHVALDNKLIAPRLDLVVNRSPARPARRPLSYRSAGKVTALSARRAQPRGASSYQTPVRSTGGISLARWRQRQEIFNRAAGLWPDAHAPASQRVSLCVGVSERGWQTLSRASDVCV